MNYKKNILNRIVSYIILLFKDIIYSSLCINAINYFSWGKLLHRNWGDDLNYYLLKELTGKSISVFLWSLLARLKRKLGKGSNYLVIGSSISMLTNERTIIWGAGVIDDNAKLPHKPKKVLAVRGPRTRAYLLRNGIDCPEVYGDPAMLVKYVYQPRIEKKYKLGIIPHYDDFNSPLLNAFRQNPNVLLIKMEGYRNWHDVIDQILSCETIASSSLHGLIIAETYHIPNLWIKISGKLIGGDFKFYDYFESIEKHNQLSFPIDNSCSVQDIFRQLDNYYPGHLDLRGLISCSPFKIKVNTSIDN